jgi:aminopeptidase YwaD
MNNKSILSMLLCILLTLPLTAQKIIKTINQEISSAQIESHIRVIASDEMRGRMTGSRENAIAARYIAEQFRSYGLKMAPGKDTYIQQVKLVKEAPASSATMTLADTTLKQWDNLIFVATTNGDFSGNTVYVNYGMDEDLENVDVKGKIVIAKAGTPTVTNPRQFFGTSAEKSKRVREMGGLALVELYRPAELPWRLLVNYLSGEKFLIDNDGSNSEGFPNAWLQDNNGQWLKYFEESKTASIKVTGAVRDKVEVPNVVAYIPGTDPVLKDEYLIISAHLDHVGVKKMSSPDEDSIFNGARDNAIGTTAMLTTAEFFAKNPQKRSIVFLACNAEEVGLLGSKYYAENPWFPLNKAIFNFNNDGAGYNDTSLITIFGLNRSTAGANISSAAAKFGLTAIEDPAPEQNLFDRSDNVSFAAKGVPAITFSQGFRAFDADIMKYYHQPSDDPNSLDYAYLYKYNKAYVYATWLLINMTEKPFWVPGDKYEEQGKKLYEIK